VTLRPKTNSAIFLGFLKCTHTTSHQKCFDKSLYKFNMSIHHSTCLIQTKFKVAMLFSMFIFPNIFLTLLAEFKNLKLTEIFIAQNSQV
jgi:hypothetical protein